jgi:hypothetical protein
MQYSPPFATPTRTRCFSVEEVLKVLHEDYGEIASQMLGHESSRFGQVIYM